MPKLIIDTSSEYCLLAVAKEGRLLSSSLFLHENRLSHSLIDHISKLTHEAGVFLKELRTIAVGVGPGSYTGTRVGVTVAKSLGFGLGTPVRGYCSLLAFLPEHEGTFLGILLAKSGLLYCLKGRRNPHAITLEIAELATPQRLNALAGNADYLCAKHITDIPSELAHLPFIPFHPHFEAIMQVLDQPFTFAFEEKAELIYLHQK